MKKSISIVLLATILLQSCVAYQKTSVPINEAQDKGPVRVSYTNRKDASFVNIILKDSIYYGISSYKHISEKPLDQVQIDGIYLKDLEKSKVQTIFLAATLTIFLVLFIGAIISITLDGL